MRTTNSARSLPTHGTVVVAVLFAGLVAAAGCGQDRPRGDPLTGGEPPPTQGPAAGELPAGHPPIPPKGLPEGHPPVAGPTDPHQGVGVTPTPGAVPPPPAAANPFTWTAPAGWTETKPSSSMRISQFELPAKWPDDVPVVCALFGAIGGGRQANVDRWISQFRQTDGSESKSKAKVTETKRDGLTVTRVELTGAFSDGMVRPPRETDDGMLLGGIVETEGGESIYLKLTGPREAVAGQAAAFDALLASLRVK